MAITTTIPFNRPSMMGEELAFITEAVNSGKISGDDPFTGRCQELLEQELGVGKVLLTPSCTHALEMAAILLNINPGDEVILPTYTFVSTANAFVLRGAKPVFIDSRPDTLNLDETKLESRITSKTKAIVPVHYAGVGCEMDAILAIAAKHGVPVVEDNAHGLFGKYRGKYLGTLGAFGTQSFHETKNFTCGEGGALLINDAAMCDRAEIIREKGTNRSMFYRGQIDKYSWVDLGSSYLPSGIASAFLYGQLICWKDIQASRRRVWETYRARLADWAGEHGVGMPTVPDECEQAYHMFYMIMPSLDARQALIAHLRQEGVQAVFHYVPLHRSKMGQQFGGKEGDCPVAEDLCDRLIRLPFYNTLTKSDQLHVIDAIKSFRWT
ncbi:MAG: dTDP-4-amino-4,6-dideoxygalactose transaminase [Candidatus Hydrogenedentes bacterium]|nr:dTDP-4-amino-4,6-dideoxygalactose transaminase [Candidatus Hydrogenedentota bacterium]